MRAPPPILGLATLTLAAACSGGGERPPNAVLVTLDTTRVDAIGAFGGPPGITPHLDALAEQGIVFEWARTVTPLTLPAHSSMLTGLYPPRHSVRDNGLNALPRSAMTLAESAQSGGFQTAAFVAATVLDRTFGLDQGFDVWRQPGVDRRETMPFQIPSIPGEEVVAGAVEWLAQRDTERPFFLWVHLFDPHRPWQSPRKFLEQARGHPYHAAVARADAAVGQLFDALRTEGELERSLILVVADHGESHDEHGEKTHGHFVFDATMRVPMILRLPPGLTEAPRVREVERGIVSVVDVFPTIAQGLGLEVPEGLDGISLLDPVPAERGVYFECYYGFLSFGWSPLAGWVDADAKYVHSSTPELYVPHAHPDERVNQISGYAEEVLERYRRKLLETHARPSLEAESADTSGALLDDLHALGYVGAASAPELPGPLEDTGLPSPHARAAELIKCERAIEAAAAGRMDEALTLLSEVARVNPRNGLALEFLAHHLMTEGSPAEAVAIFREALKVVPERASIHAGLGRSLERLGEVEEAVGHLRRAAELDPGDPDHLRRVIAVLERTGQPEEAELWRARLLELPGS
jgi:arylsulfatase A-like enzyme